MDTHQVRNTRFWKDFFRMYRSMPELWLTTAKEYRNRKLKAKSYEQLLQHMRTSDPNINIHMLKRKINNLRTSYRRELRKVLDNKAALERGDFERGSDDDYKPSLWYYNELEFLHDLETSETPITIQPEPEPEHYQERTEIVADDMDDNVVEVTLEEPEPDEDIFAEPYQPGEDMLVMEGEGDNEVDGDADVDNESIVDGDGDGDGVGVVMAEQEEQEHATLNETRHKSDIKMESKYQPQQQHSSNNSINNNNSSARHTRIHPYGIAQTRQHQQQQQQQQYHHRQQQHQQQQQHQRRINALQQMRRRRQSSTNDADVDGDSYVDIDIDEERSIAAGKKRRRQQQQMMSTSSLEQQHTEQTESECDLIGKRMAAHFRNMRPDQRLFAERIISEVLVFGRMNRLSLSARFLPNGGGGGVGDVYARVDGK